MNNRWFRVYGGCALYLVQEGRRLRGRRKQSLYGKLFNLFSLLGYFRHAALL